MAKSKVPDIYWRLANRVRNSEENIGEFESAAKIFQRLLTLEQAELAEAFPATAEELAAKLGRSLASVNNDLQYMYRIGMGTPSAKSGRWNIPRSPMLFFDKLCTHHRNSKVDFRDLLSELNEDRYQATLRRQKEHPKKEATADELEEFIGGRVLPSYFASKDDPELQPWESMKGILQMADKITVVDCPCRMRTLGKEDVCQLPGETQTCFLLNRDAEYAVDSGSASRFWTVEEAMKRVEELEKVGMIHNVGNFRGITSLLCNCCSDHCMGIERWYREGKPVYPRKASRFLPVVNAALCKGHGDCVERCFFDGVSRKRDIAGRLKAVIDETRCLGCGACALGCTSGAITMKCVHPESWVPKGMHTRPGETRDYEQYANL